MILKDGMILYHGSYTEIDRIDLNLCRDAKDFGRGFYLTTSKAQAVSFIKTSLAKAKRIGRAPAAQTFGFVTQYRLHLNPKIKVFEFDGVNKDWLYYISINRRTMLSGRLNHLLSENLDNYDIMIGKIANDDTNATLNAFLAGTYGEVGDDTSFEIVTRLLKPDRLENQFCFKTDCSLALLEKIGAEKHEI